MSPRNYRSFAEFDREYLRPARTVGQSFEDMVKDNPFEVKFDVDRDPFEEKEEEEDEY